MPFPSWHQFGTIFSFQSAFFKVKGRNWNTYTNKREQFGLPDWPQSHQTTVRFLSKDIQELLHPFEPRRNGNCSRFAMPVWRIVNTEKDKKGGERGYKPQQRLVLLVMFHNWIAKTWELRFTKNLTNSPSQRKRLRWRGMHCWWNKELHKGQKW